jgi:hypothetical protein
MHSFVMAKNLSLWCLIDQLRTSGIKRLEVEAAMTLTLPVASFRLVRLTA